MLIKSTTKKGDPVRFSPDECLERAVVNGVKSQNTESTVFWVLVGSVVKSVLNFTKLGTDKWGNDEWEATASGTALVGKTVAATDDFHIARPHNFSVTYKTSLDNLGMPDIEVVDFKLDPVRNASEIAALAVDNTPKAALAKKPAPAPVAAPKSE